MPHCASTSRSVAIRVWTACAPCPQPKREPAVIQACWTSQCLTTGLVGFLCAWTKRIRRSARVGSGSSCARSRCALRGSTNAGGRAANAAVPVAGGAATGAAGFGAAVVVVVCAVVVAGAVVVACGAAVVVFGAATVVVWCAGAAVVFTFAIVFACFLAAAFAGAFGVAFAGALAGTVVSVLRVEAAATPLEGAPRTSTFVPATEERCCGFPIWLPDFCSRRVINGAPVSMSFVPAFGDWTRTTFAW